MFENNNIDDIFKKSLGNFQEEPSEELWLNVEKKLWLKKVLRISRYFIIGACLVFVATLTYVSVNNKKDHNTPLNNSKQEEKIIAQNNKSTEVIKSENTNHTTALSDSKSTPINDAAKKETSQTTVTNKAKTSPSDTDNQFKTKVDYSSVAKNNKKVKENKKLQVAENLKKNNAPKTNREESQTQGSEKTKENSSDIKINDKEFAQRVEKENLPVKTETSQTASNNVQEQALKNAANPQSQTEVAKTKVEGSNKDLSKNEINKSDGNKNETAKSSTSKAPVSNKINQTEAFKSAYEILFYIMPSYTSKTLSGLSQDEINFRNANEKKHIFLNYGLEFRYRISNFTIETGLIQTQSGEKNNYDYKRLGSVDTTGSHNDIHLVSYIDPQNSNNTIVTFDSTWIKVADSTFANAKLSNVNVIKYIEIPVKIGYVFNVNRHQFGINGGVSCALLSQVSVSLYDNETKEIRQITKKDNMYKKTMWSYNVSLSYSYLIGRKTSVFIQSGFKKNLNSVLNNSSTKQTYQFIDTKVGIMVKL